MCYFVAEGYRAPPGDCEVLPQRFYEFLGFLQLVLGVLQFPVSGADVAGVSLDSGVDGRGGAHGVGPLDGLEEELCPAGRTVQEAGNRRGEQVGQLLHLAAICELRGIWRHHKVALPGPGRCFVPVPGPVRAVRHPIAPAAGRGRRA